MGDRVAPLVFQELGAKVTAIGVKPNGVNINREHGALHPARVRAEVLRRGAAIGIALDGDADRVIVVDERGNLVDGDAVMAMCATRMIRDGELRKATVVATVMSNLGLERALAAQGARLLRTPVGDRHVVEAMRAGGYNLGGEQSEGQRSGNVDHQQRDDQHAGRGRGAESECTWIYVTPQWTCGDADTAHVARS